MRSRSRPEWLGGDDLEAEVLPAVSTSSQAFAAILDDLVRAVDAPDLSGLRLGLDEPDPGAVAVPTPSPSADPSEGASSALPEAVEGAHVPFDAAPGGEGAHATPPETARDGVLRRAAPARLRGKGDLTLVVGLGSDAADAARVLAASVDAEVLPVGDRREALAARAEGVRQERPIVGVVELPRVDAVPALAAALASIAPDQVWAAVDASRKLDDTAVWVRAVDAVLAVDGLAARNGALTATPWAVGALGLPLLWLDTPPAG
ncbi:hypothetical protein [Leifsonia shinshuensis]|uniref:Uncharacterized protein n=1 Tax=Leifsonia shinshuensis TaxID=150026 RepID=A0A853CMR9_9MICO|nr:hypothetical protein [Leifsonia shinshuensis]